MPAFVFRLAPVLRLREATRDERRGRLAEALRLEAELQERLAGVERELHGALRAAQQAASPGTVNVDRLIDAERFELTLRGECQQVRRQLQALIEEIERRRLALAAADREVRVLEMLRERQLESHQAEERKGEQRVLDEAAARRFAWEEAT